MNDGIVAAGGGTEKAMRKGGMENAVTRPCGM